MKKRIERIFLLLLFSININADSFTIQNQFFDFDVSKIACEEGNARECINLTLKYIKGTDNLEKDYKKASFFAEKACKYKNRIGCMILINIDEEEKKDSLRQSCEDGDDKACWNLKVLKNKRYYLLNGKCSKCGSTHIGRYQYGLVHPDKAMQKKIDNGEIILGGCVISGDSPKNHCLKCGATLYDLDRQDRSNQLVTDSKDDNISIFDK